MYIERKGREVSTSITKQGKLNKGIEVKLGRNMNEYDGPLKLEKKFGLLKLLQHLPFILDVICLSF